MHTLDMVDSLWAKVATTVGFDTGALADSPVAVAKVSTHLQQRGGNYVICLYSKDSYNKKQVGDVFRTCFQELGFVPLAFKVSDVQLG